MKETFSSLRVRNFRLFFIGQLVSNTGNWLTNTAIILLVIKLTHSGFAVGLLAACSFGPILLFTAWAGSIVDRTNKRNLLLLTQSLEMLQSFGLAGLAFMHNPPLWAVYSLALLGGIFLAFDNPVRRSFVNEMVPKEEIPNAVTLYGIIVNGSRVFGPALAGFLVISAGFGWAFIVDAVSYIVVIFCILRMRVSELYLRPVSSKVKGTVRDGLRYVRSSPELRICFIMLGIIGIFTYNFTVTLPLLMTDGLHSGTDSFTLLYSVFSIGSITGALFIAKMRLTQLKHVVYGALAMGVSLIVLAFVPNVTAALVAGFLVGASSLVYITATTTMMQIKAAPEMTGRVLALQSVFLFGTTPIGGPILGAISDIKGGRMPILIGGVVSIITGLYGFAANKKEAKVAS